MIKEGQDEELRQSKKWETLYHRSVGEIYKLRQLLKECYTVVDMRKLYVRGKYITEGMEVYKSEADRLDALLTKINEVLK